MAVELGLFNNLGDHKVHIVLIDDEYMEYYGCGDAAAATYTEKSQNISFIMVSYDTAMGIGDHPTRKFKANS